jgi:acyl carrier protein
MTSIEKLQEAFSTALALPNGLDYEALAYGQVEGWDSVAHLNLVAEIESKFDIMLATEDVIDLSSFPKAKEILGKYDVAF